MATFNADEIYALIEAQAAMGARRPGSPADRENEAFIAAQLRSYGYPEVRLEPIPITWCEPTRYALQVGDRPVDCFGIPYTASTPPQGVTAPLVYADSARAWPGGPDWKGKIVVTDIHFPPLDAGLLTKISRGYHDPDGTLGAVHHPATWVRLGWHIYGRAARLGAAGFIGIVRDQPGGSCQMYAPYGFREADILDKPVPGLWVGRAEGDALVAAAKAGTSATLTLEGVREPVQTHNVVAELPGTLDEALVLHCHHDSPFVSPVEDGSGVAVVLAMARHFAQQRTLRRRLIVLLTAGHFYGSIGTRTFLHQHRQDLVPKVALEMTIEHVAREATEQNGVLVPTGLPEPTGVFAPFNQGVIDRVLASLVRHDLRRSVILPPEGPLGDFPPTDGGDWYEAGVPVINHISNPVYLLTSDDGLGWVDRPRLAATAAAYTEMLEEIDKMSKSEIAKVDLPLYRLAMKALKGVQRARTTGFGTRPVY